VINEITYLYRVPRYFLRKIKEHRFTQVWQLAKNGHILESRKRLEALRSKHAGEPCVLIRGGPSINKMDLNLFRGMISIACNGFHLKLSELDFEPTYYTVEDPLPAQDNAGEILSTNSIKVIPYDLKPIFSKLDDSLVYSNLRRSKVSYRSRRFPLFSHDFAEESYWGGTVMYYNIQLANFLGCNPIYLVWRECQFERAG
jgi:hypothetical protein